MNDVRQVIEYRVNALNGLIKVKAQAIRNAPDGKVKIDHTGGTIRFYCVRSDGKKDRLNKDDAHKLIQRLYDKKIIESAIKERDYLIRILSSYPNGNVEEVIKSFNSDRRQLITPVRKPDSEYIDSWNNTPYTKKTITSGTLIYKTKKGDYVRSKSELIIADRLYTLGIPYRYEAELILGDATIYPDFTILDVKRHRVVYLEHLGMMDDAQYAANAVQRINLYQHHNILMGDRLFITMETDKNPLDTEVVDTLLRLFLVQPTA